MGSVAMIETWVDASSRALSRELTCVSSASARRRSANRPIWRPSVVIAWRSGSSRSMVSRERNIMMPMIGPASLATTGKPKALRNPRRAATSLRTRVPAGSFARSATQAEQPVAQTLPVSPSPGENSRSRDARIHSGPMRRDVQGLPAIRNTSRCRSTIQNSATSKSSVWPMVERSSGIASLRRAHAASVCIVAC